MEGRDGCRVHGTYAILPCGGSQRAVASHNCSQAAWLWGPPRASGIKCCARASKGSVFGESSSCQGPRGRDRGGFPAWRGGGPRAFLDLLAGCLRRYGLRVFTALEHMNQGLLLVRAHNERPPHLHPVQMMSACWPRVASDLFWEQIEVVTSQSTTHLRFFSMLTTRSVSRCGTTAHRRGCWSLRARGGSGCGVETVAATARRRSLGGGGPFFGRPGGEPPRGQRCRLGPTPRPARPR